MRLAVLLTVYERLPYFPEQLKQLKAQTNQDFDLWVCNNSPEDIGHHGLVYPFRYVDYHNESSIFGRIFMIRDFLLAEGYDAILTLDDDEVLPVNLIDQCFRQFEPDAIKSFWAFETSTDYWTRRRLKGAETGDYAGMGGCLTPAEFWSLPAIYSVPEHFQIIDDLWISHCALKYTDYKIKPLNVAIKFISSEGTKATYKKIRPLKTAFHRDYIMPYKRNSKG